MDLLIRATIYYNFSISLVYPIGLRKVTYTQNIEA